MDIYFGAAAIVFGAIIGSFINALLTRFNTGRGMGGRSKCDSCGHVLSALDLIPILSYLFLRGRCRYCKARIALQNLLIEITAAGLSLLIFLTHPEPLAYFFWLVVWMILLFVVVYDLRHTIIPWTCSGLLAALALASLFINFGGTPFFVEPSITMLLAGPALALPLFLLSLVSRGKWMGWGDGSLELSIGWFLGLSMGATALMLAFWVGAFTGVALLLFSQAKWHLKAPRLTIQSEIPFAPFLVFGMFLVYFFHVDFFSSLTLW